MQVTQRIHIDESELHESYLAATGPGGQNVNKVAAAVQMRFNVVHSPSLPEDVRQRVISRYRARLTKAGELILTADRFRLRERNRIDARERLAAMIAAVAEPPKKRKPTRPTLASKERRLSGKSKRGAIKQNRGRPRMDD